MILKTEITYRSKKYQINLTKPIDISIAIDTKKKNINAWYINDPKIYPVEENNWKATVKDGAAINFNKFAIDLRYERGLSNNEVSFLDNNGIVSSLSNFLTNEFSSSVTEFP